MSAATENGNPLFWDEAVADELTDGPIAPPTMLLVWFRPHHWSPGRTEPAVPLQRDSQAGKGPDSVGVLATTRTEPSP